MASCPNLVRITIIDGTLIEATESDFEEYIYDPGNVETDKKPTSDDIGLNCINQTTLTHWSFVRYVPSRPAEKNDRRKSAIFHTFTKIGDKNCKVVVDSESCINAISSKSLKNMGLEVVPHPNPFKVSWIDSMMF